MSTNALLQNLMAVECALQRGDCAAAQRLLLDAQEAVLQIDREMIAMQEQLSASPAHSYQAVAADIRPRRILGRLPTLGAWKYRGGRRAWKENAPGLR